MFISKRIAPNNNKQTPSSHNFPTEEKPKPVTHNSRKKKTHNSHGNTTVLSTEALNANPVAAISSNWANHKTAPVSTPAHWGCERDSWLNPKQNKMTQGHNLIWIVLAKSKHSRWSATWVGLSKNEWRNKTDQHCKLMENNSPTSRIPPLHWFISSVSLIGQNKRDTKWLRRCRGVTAAAVATVKSGHVRRR